MPKRAIVEEDALPEELKPKRQLRSSNAGDKKYFQLMLTVEPDAALRELYARLEKECVCTGKLGEEVHTCCFEPVATHHVTLYDALMLTYEEAAQVHYKAAPPISELPVVRSTSTMKNYIKSVVALALDEPMADSLYDVQGLPDSGRGKGKSMAGREHLTVYRMKPEMCPELAVVAKGKGKHKEIASLFANLRTMTSDYVREKGGVSARGTGLILKEKDAPYDEEDGKRCRRLV